MAQVIDASWHPLVDGIPPDWASCWGQDLFGVWAGFTIGEVTQRMRWIAPGQFLMGSPEDEPGRFPDEGPRHEVTIRQGFWLFETPCTEALWEAVTNAAPEDRRGPAFPITAVSWDDAIGFIGQLNAAIGGLDLHLPSEAQWEYGCRAGTQTPYHFGQTITRDQVCYDTDAPVAVASLPANSWGLREMHGNVWEWCADDWHDNYDGAPTDGLAWIDDDRAAAGRVLRGGSWGSEARDVRSAYRYRDAPADRGDDAGFRCARVQ